MNKTNAIEKAGNCCTVPATTHGNGAAEERWTYRPATDILDQGREYTIFADVPGAAPDSVNVTFQGGIVTIEAGVAPRQSRQTAMRLQEYGVGDYHRQFNLGDLASAIDEDAVEARCVNGLLTVRLPKKAAAQPRRISVKAS